MGGIYVHIPFCGAKCTYCDFFSVKMSQPPFELYARRVVEELSARIDELTFPISTIYLGGGTPSLLPPDVITYLSKNILSLSGASESIKEFTIEVNPDDVTPELVSAWREAGVNRVSMGVQSMVDTELQTVGRRHDAATVCHARHLLRDFKNVSADVIFGLPGQTMESLEYTLNEIFSLGFTHISVYNLMYEPGTVLTHRRDKGLIVPTDDDVIMEMYEKIGQLTSSAGFRHYEISNYSLPGYESAHNMSYWTGIPYIGLGAGAHSYDGKRTRRCNANNLREYIEGNCIFEVENLSDGELRDEYILTRLRTTHGISISDFSSRFGTEASEGIIRKAQQYISDGLLRFDRTTQSLALTEKGVMMSDAVILALAE